MSDFSDNDSGDGMTSDFDIIAANDPGPDSAPLQTPDADDGAADIGDAGDGMTPELDAITGGGNFGVFAAPLPELPDDPGNLYAQLVAQGGFGLPAGTIAQSLSDGIYHPAADQSQMQSVALKAPDGGMSFMQGFNPAQLSPSSDPLGYVDRAQQPTGLIKDPNPPPPPPTAQDIIDTSDRAQKMATDLYSRYRDPANPPPPDVQAQDRKAFQDMQGKLQPMVNSPALAPKVGQTSPANNAQTAADRLYAAAIHGGLADARHVPPAASYGMMFGSGGPDWSGGGISNPNNFHPE